MKKYTFLILFSVLVIFGKTSAQQGEILRFKATGNTVITLSNLTLLGSFTIEAWVKPSTKADFETILSNKTSGIGNPGFFFAINNYATTDGMLVFETQNAGCSGTTAVTWGVWQHVAITWDGTNAQIYLNGLPLGMNTPTSVNLASSPNPCYIGDIPSYIGNANLDGAMDELRVWNYARTQNEIQSAMNCPLHGNEVGLSAYYQFNEGIADGNNPAVTNLPDMTVNNHFGTLQNFALSGMSSNWSAPSPVTTIPLTSQTLALCEGNSLTVGTHVHDTTGIFYDTLSSVMGCDSVIKTNLTITPATPVHNPQNICSGQSYNINSHSYSTPGNYTDTLHNALGCDSIVVTDITVTVVDTSVIVNGITLTSNASALCTFQWIDCGNGNSPITGANSGSYTPMANGSYAVVVRNGGCRDTSLCYNIFSVGNVDKPLESELSISPNPSKGQFYISGKYLNNSVLCVYDVLGSLIYRKEIKSVINELFILNISSSPVGVYFLTLRNSDTNKIYRIIKE